ALRLRLPAAHPQARAGLPARGRAARAHRRHRHDQTGPQPAYARIVEDPRARIANPRPSRRAGAAVAAPLAEPAVETTDQGRAGQLRDLSGVEPLLAALRRYSMTGTEQVRFHNAARVLAEVCRALAAQTQ